MQLYDLTKKLPNITRSENTQRAYYRWIDRFISNMTDKKPARGDARMTRLERIPIKLLHKIVTSQNLTQWLATLVEDGHSRQSLDQARASIVVLSQLLADDGIFDAQLMQSIQNVSVPNVPKNHAPDRLLSNEQIQQLLQSAQEMATSDTQRVRNYLVVNMLCTLALRREELSFAKWGHVTLQDNNIILQLPNNEYLALPNAIVQTLDHWRNQISVYQTPASTSPLIRRIWKGGRISKNGLSPDGIWLIIREASLYAHLDSVTPDDLRRSAVANLYQSGTPIEEISRLLRHKNTLITERFIAKLPINE